MLAARLLWASSHLQSKTYLVPSSTETNAPERHRKAGEDDASKTFPHKCTHCGREFKQPGGLGLNIYVPVGHSPDHQMLFLACGVTVYSNRERSGFKLGRHKQ